MAEVSTAPINTFPTTSSSPSRNSISVLFTKDVISSALFLRRIPSSVRIIFLPVRMNKDVFNSSSKSLICLDKAD